jgi:hypothetical protein
MQTIKLTFRSLDKHVCSLKWAQRLREIGIRQDTYFHWIYDEKNEIWEVCWSDYFDETDTHCAAFTAQDFIDLFPKYFRMVRNENEWGFDFGRTSDYAETSLKEDENLANVFARILIAITKDKSNKTKKLGHK